MIENYLSVIFLSETEIIIQTKNKKLYIIGSDLMLSYYSTKEIRGIGNIKEVRFS